MVAANGLIGTTSAPLGDYFWGNILEIFSKKVFKKIFFFKWYYFVNVYVKILAKNVIFKVFEVHLQVFLQVLLLLKNSGYKSFYSTFEGPNANEIISYFGYL
jgi:hypothetical protein